MRNSARAGRRWDYVKFDRWEEAQRKFMMKHAAAEVWNGIQETFNRLIGCAGTGGRPSSINRDWRRIGSWRIGTLLRSGRYVRGHMARLYVVKLVAARLALRRYNAATAYPNGGAPHPGYGSASND